MNQTNNAKKIIAPLAGLALVAVVILGYSRFQATQNAEVATSTGTGAVPAGESNAAAIPLETGEAPTPATPTPGAPAQPVPVTSSMPTKLGYIDGTYSAEGAYRAPSGNESIGVTLTVKGDVVTAATIAVNAENSTSIRYQKMFQENFAQYVIGKDLSTLKLGRVSGSSLTPNGFNAAIDKIWAQASA